MDNPHNTHYYNLQGSAQSQRELGNAQVTVAVIDEEEATPTSKKVYDSGIPSPPQSPQRASSSSVSLDSIPEGPPEEASTSQVEELENPLHMLYNAQNIKVCDLVDFLLFKYQMKAFTTKAEMLKSIGREYEAYYPLIFSEASECLKLVFGIDMIEVDPFVHSYILVTALGLTYNGILTDVQGKPKRGLLIVVLGVIFMKGNCVSEEIIWKMLNNIRLGGYVYQDPRKLISEEFVQERDLEYRQVPNSDPLSYEFLWGPRVFAETSKLKVLEFFASSTKIDPRVYTEKYAEALRDEIEGAQARIAHSLMHW